MPNPGESRLAPRIGVAVILLAAIGGGLWWWKNRGTPDAPATSTVTQPQGAGSSAAAVPPGSTVEPARITVVVTDDQGPLAGATVRLAPGDGEVVVVKTGRDGVARAEPLEPGRWAISASADGHVPAALPTRQLAAGADEKLAIQLAAGGRALSGTVSDVSGGPIAGARVDAARLDSAADPGDAVSTTLTGADGKYRLTVADGQLLVAAASADYAPQSRYVEVGPAGAVADFALVPGGVIEGVVRDERTREPVAGAIVLARRDSPSVLLAETGARRAMSGGDGRFRLAGLRPGAWELGATHQGRYARAETIIGLGIAEQVSDVELMIGKGPVIRGRVVDDSGAPAPDAAVRAFARGEGTSSKADAQGAFTLEALPPGDYLVTASADTYLPSSPARVTLADQDVDGVVVTVRRAARLKGHVEPRQECSIRVELDERREPLWMMSPGATTGPDGEFELGPLGNGPTTLVAQCTSGDQGQASVVVAPGMAPAIIQVAPGGSIAGRVVDGNGKPVAGIAVMASNTSGGERTTIVNGLITSGVQGLTDATGAYKIAGLPRGSYRLTVLDRGKPLRPRARPPRVELAANERKTGVDLAIDLPDGVISGTVTGPDGKPLADAWVSVHQDMLAMLESMRGDPGDEPRDTRMMVLENREGADTPESSFPPALTDAAGRYQIRGLPRASYTVIAEAQRGQLRARATGIKPDATVDLKVQGLTSLAGTVTAAGGPVRLFSVELEGPSRTQRSFTDGSFLFSRVDPGSYTVRVQSSDGNGQARVEVKPGEAATIDIKLSSNAIVTGKLVDPAGNPIADQAIALIPDTGDGRLQVMLEGPPQTTRADGSFRPVHRAEKAILIVMRPPRPFTRRGLVLEAGKTLDLGTITVEVPEAPGPGSGGP
jgi:hypothetical protein